MIKISKIILTVIILLTLVNCSSLKKTTNTHELSTVLNNITAKATIITSLKSTTCKAADSWMWGSEQSCPKNIIETFEVQKGNEKIFIPISAFTDLGNPQKLIIEQNKPDDVFTITIVGGDASVSYAAALNFKDGYINEKIVRHGEFPNEVWEKTTYKFNNNNE